MSTKSLKKTYYKKGHSSENNQKGRCIMMCNENCGCNTCFGLRSSCLDVIGAIFAALFTLVLGIILGAVFAETILANLAALIVLAVVLFVLLVVFFILRYCRCRY